MSDNINDSALYPAEFSEAMWFEIIGLSEEEKQRLDDPSLVIHWNFPSPKPTPEKKVKK